MILGYLIDNILHKTDESGYRLLTCRITAEDTFLAHALEERGFRLCDVLNIYVSELDVSELTVADEKDEAIKILDRCLEDMSWGRVYQDPNIDHSLAKKFYRDSSAWILSQKCHVTIARVNGHSVGLAIGIIDQQISDNISRNFGALWLIAVDREYRGMGVGKKLLQDFSKEFSTQVDLLEIGTQVSNIPANRMYLKANYQPLTQALTFHRWSSGNDIR